MGVLNITEAPRLVMHQGGVGQVLPLHEVTVQAISTSGTSAQSAALQATTRFVRLAPSTAVHIATGTDPTASSATTYMPAGTVETFEVQPGASYKIAVIDA